MGYEFTPQQQVDFNEKLKRVRSQKYSRAWQAYVDEWDDDLANKIFVSPADKALYNMYRRGSDRWTPEEQALAAKIQGAESVVNRPAESIIEKRREYLDNAVKELVNVQQQTSFTLEAFEAPDRKRAQAVATRIINNIVGAGKEGTGGRYDLGDLKEMLGKSADNTTYSLVSKGRGRYALGVSNTEVTAEPIEIEITKNQAEELFGQSQFLDDFYNIRQSLQLTRGTGKWTTDVRGLGRQSAFNLNNGLLNNYSVKYHVEDPIKNGGLQVRLYIFDKEANQWLPDRTAKFGQLLNEAQVTRFLSAVGDQYIQSILGTDSTNQ